MESLRETLLCHYCYDALDRLIANELPSTPGRQRFYCKSRLATDIQGAMRQSIFQQGDQLLAQQQSKGDVFDATLLATDQQRSVLQTLKANHPRQPIAYSPHGHRPAEGGLLSLLGFNGERPDPVTGHYLLGNGYRAFNPVLKRFNSPDSWSPFGKGGLNSYAYCSGDPVNRLDPGGHLSALTVQAIGKFSLMAKRAKAKATQQNWSKGLRLKSEEVVKNYTIKHYRDNIKTIELSPPQPPFPTLEELAFNRAEKQAGKVIGAPANYKPPSSRQLAPAHNEETYFANYAYNTLTTEQQRGNFEWQPVTNFIYNKAKSGQIFGVRRSMADDLSMKFFYPEPPKPHDIYGWIYRMRSGA